MADKLNLNTDPSLMDRDKNSFRESPAHGRQYPARAVVVENTDPIPVTFSSSNITTPTITNLSVPTANTEVSHVLQTNLKRITLKCRGLARVQFAFVSTESSTKFITIHPGATYSEEGLNLTGKTIYLQTSLASQTVEILEWT